MAEKPWYRPRGPHLRLPPNGKEVLARWQYPPREERCVMKSLHDDIDEGQEDTTVGLIWVRVSDGTILDWPDEWQHI